MFEIWLPLLGGLLLLVAGGEFLVRGSVDLAKRLGISPLVIGLTLVGFGTSTPELVTSVQAALLGAPGIAYGNIVGSNIANILLILGASTILLPLRVSSAALRRDGTVMLAATLVFAVLAVVMPLGRIEGSISVLLLAIYIYVAIRQERHAAAGQHGALHEKADALQSADAGACVDASPKGPFLIPLVTAVGGLGAVVAGGSFFVDGAVALARSLAVSETLIGLTIVAVGTSLPELVTSVLAAIRRQGDIAFGNIVGSNIYNILGIGGATALVAPGPVPAEIVGFDIPVMIGVTVLVVLFARTGLRIGRREGMLLLCGYIAYVLMNLL